MTKYVEHDRPSDKPKRSKNSGFFALDTHQFRRIPELGLGIEEAATYLALLKSTDESNILSKGGVNSVTNYTGLSRAEVKRSKERLVNVGLIIPCAVERARARTVVRQELPTHDSRTPLAPKEKAIIEAINAGQQPETQSQKQAAHRAAQKGWIENRSDGWRLLETMNKVAFVPNSFVATKTGSSPLARLVNNGELGPIMLAAELYQLQDLMDHRGVPLEAIRGYFKPYLDSYSVDNQCRLHTLVAGRDYSDKEGSFTAVQKNKWHLSYDNFWDNIHALDAAHVIEWAVYSANGRHDDQYAYNRPQRPLGVLRNGKQLLDTPESRPAFMSFLINKLTELNGVLSSNLPELVEEWRTTNYIYAVENASVSHVEGVSILRMAHRAATERKAVWYRDLIKECDRAFFFLEKIARNNFPQISDFTSQIYNTAQFGSSYLNEAQR